LGELDGSVGGLPLLGGESVAQGGKVPDPRVLGIGRGQLAEVGVGVLVLSRLEEPDALVEGGSGRGGGGRPGRRGGGLLADLLDLVAKRGNLRFQVAERLV